MLLVVSLLFWKVFTSFCYTTDYSAYSKDFVRKSYLDLNIWYFFKNLYFINKGNLSNNFNISIIYWTLHNGYHSLLRVENSYDLYVHSKFIVNYVKEIKIIRSTLNKKILNRATFLIVFILLRPFSTFLNSINISYSFLFLCRISNFFIFYNAFYFKVFNY